ncbi:tetratricopeptide repeat-containing diguanylate cyclase [Vibrio rotiferianus]|uniref:tetratricopeptide repeat-containing diguanylate cyclase n=1 Tax=Vibrio rotiferianus TaxID=190895 RepID=UPI00406A6745
MRKLFLIFTLLAISAPLSAENTQSMTNWHSVYQRTVKTNKELAINMLQDRYHAISSPTEKLYISGLILDYMFMLNQPYFGNNQAKDGKAAHIESSYLNAIANRKKGKYGLSVDKFTELLNMAKADSNSSMKTLFNYQLCYTLNEQGKYHQANFYCSSLEAALAKGDLSYLPLDLAYRVIANNYDHRGDYQEALTKYALLLNVLPDNSDPTGIYNDAALLMIAVGQYEQAKDYLFQALSIRLDNGSPLEVAQVEHSLATLFRKTHEYQLATQHYQNALHILQEEQFHYGLGLTYLGLGNTILESGDFERSLPYLVKALNLGKQTQNHRLQVESYIALADSYLSANALPQAKVNAMSALSLENDSSAPSLQAQALLISSKIEQKQKNFESALSYYEKYAELELATRDANNIRALKALDLTKKELEHELSLIEIRNAKELKQHEFQELQYQQRAYNFVIACLIVAIGCILAVHKKAKTKAQFDDLTGVLNRASVIKKIRAKTAIEKSEDKHVLALLDLDKFKNINDIYGHPTGDKVLRHICNSLSSKLNKGELIGRLGGEEFIILLTHVDEIDVPFRINSLHKTISEKHINSESHQPLKVTASLSYLSTSKSLKDFDELYSILDQALYQVKKTGRNAVIDAYNEPIDLPPSAFQAKNA